MVLALVLLTGCGSERRLTELPDPAAEGRVQGRVWTPTGEPIVAARVEAADIDTLTDAEGFFTLEGLPVGEPLLVRATAEGYSTNGAILQVDPDGWAAIDLRLKAAETLVWDPAVGGAVESSDGVRVELAPEGLRNADGSAVTQPATVTITSLSTQEEMAAAPGRMMASRGDALALLESLGMVEVRLTDGDGAPLSLAAPATLSFPVADVWAADGSPGEFELFGYDPDTGRWQRSGGGTVRDGRFQATVEHFSWWNCDRYANTDQCVTGQLVTATGAPVADATLTVEETLTLTSGSFSTDAEGGFQIDLPTGERVALALEYGPWSWASSDDPRYADGISLPGVAAENKPEDCVQLGEIVVSTRDDDDDGYIDAEDGGPDCDALDASVHPGADEVWYDGVDQDCDERSDYDQDGDGYDIDSVSNGTDCDDTDYWIRPGAVEYCEQTGAQIDDNCSGDAESDAVDGFTWYTDADGDGYGGDASAQSGCAVPDADVILAGGDCDDGASEIHPGPRSSDEDCSDRTTDYNCDSITPDYRDLDDDGQTGCEGDCDDDDGSVHSGATEVCDGSDNDCDGAVDDGENTTWYRDVDADGHGDDATRYEGTSCAPDGYTASGDDCDDLDPTRYPGADEVCNDGLVNDCEGTDEGALDACEAHGELDLNAADYILSGEDIGGLAGDAVAFAGDVDGDGLDDLIAGAAVRSSGTAYVVLASQLGSIRELADASAILRGSGWYREVGAAVAGAGDLDGDGLADLLIGAPDSLWDDCGAAFVVLGSGAIGEVVLEDDADGRWEGLSGSLLGESIAGAGDVDGDGLGDALIGAPYDDEEEEAGRAYLLLGAGLLAEGDAEDADAIWTSDEAGAGLGTAVASAGDVDGDGLDDQLFGAPWADGAGAAYLFLAGSAGSTADADGRWAGEASLDEAGSAVAGAGDVDGDGLQDLLIGAKGLWVHDTQRGGAYLVLATQAVSTAGLDAADLRLRGEEEGDMAGYAVAGAGDVNGDGRPELMVSANEYGSEDGGYAGNGAVYVVMGPAPSGTVSLGDADARWRGHNPEDMIGSALAGAADVNGDGLQDLMVGANVAYALGGPGKVFVMLSATW